MSKVLVTDEKTYMVNLEGQFFLQEDEEGPSARLENLISNLLAQTIADASVEVPSGRTYNLTLTAVIQTLDEDQDDNTD